MSVLDFSDIRGLAPRALDRITAAAAHREPLLLVGPQGAGKTMLARRIATLLPDGRDAHGGPVAAPFRAPHLSASWGAIAGKGTRPGEIDLARGGVLFIDDAADWPAHTLHAIITSCEAIDDGTRPLLILAVRACACGRWPEGPHAGCSCSTPARRIWDRLVEHIGARLSHRVDLPLIRPADRDRWPTAPTTATMRARVAAAAR